MAKLYFLGVGEDICYQIDHWKDYMLTNGLKSLELFEAKIEYGTGYFFCREFQEVGESGNCGKACDKYQPNNGKNGRCNHYGYVYECTDILLILTN